MKHVHTLLISSFYTLICMFIIIVGYFTFSFSNSKNTVGLINDPSNLLHHFDLVSSLIEINRLDDARVELSYIRLANKQVNSHSDSQKLLPHYERQLLEKERVYSESLKGYVHWNNVIQNNLGYRDGYYMFSYYSYILFNKTQAKQSIEKALYLDPLFPEGKSVLHGLSK
ncbi:MAG: hypothetical protein M3P33_00810 [bacterium]|nr:hypothetical protein [bacterium]